MLKIVIGNAVMRESVALCAEHHVTNYLAIFVVTNYLHVVIAALVSVEKIVQMIRTALNAAQSRLRRTLSTCLNSIHTKNKT